MACPCSRRTGALTVGICDLILGSAGLSAVCFLLYIISTEISSLEDDSQFNERMHILTGLYWTVMLAYVFPSGVTLLIGLFTVCGVDKSSDCCVITSILLSIILVFSCGGILLILYVLGIELPFLAPLMGGTAVHMYFTFVLLTYRSNDLKRQRTV